MEWFIFALISPILFASTNVIDKFILTKKIKDPFSYSIISMVFYIIPLILLAPFLTLSLSFQSFLAILYGIAFTGLGIFYCLALMKEEASRIISIEYTSPIFTLILSAIFLQEYLTLQNSYIKYLGVIFLTISAMLVTYKHEKKKFHLSLAVIFILLFAFGYASTNVLSKYALYDIDYWSFFFWTLIGNLIGGFVMIIVPKIRRNLIKHTLSIDRKTWLIILSVDILVWLGYLTLFIAIQSGFVTLVNALMSIQPLVVFLIMVSLTVHRPKVLKEEISRTSLILKSIAVILIFIGSYLIIVV